MKKKIFILFMLFLLIGSWITFVFWNFINFDKSIKLENILSKNVFLWTNLNKTILVYKSSTNLKDYKVISYCKNESKFLANSWDLYYFSLEFLDNICDNPNIILGNSDSKIENTLTKLKIDSEYNIFNFITDYDNKKLEKALEQLESSISKLEILKSQDKTFEKLQKKRKLEEAKYKKYLISKVYEWRKLKYDVPVRWHSITTEKNEVPNAGRPYREEYTDWIHHGWDVDDKIWTNVIALDDWIIIRTVRNFEFLDLNNLKKWNKLSEDDKLLNLDILRWNQVWLKTTKGDVIFYAHLEKVFSDVIEWKIVKRWYPLWTIWISWVPDKAYTKSHLHFEISKNPHINKNAGKYIIEDYLKWDWELKWLWIEEVLEKQKKVFN